MAEPEFFPMSPPKEVTTVKAKPKPSREELEKIEPPKNPVIKKAPSLEGQPKPKKKRAPKKSKKLEVSSEEYSHKNSNPKEKITLVITEKPQAAMKIAYALSDTKPTARKVGQVTYFEVNRGEEKIIVGCAVGHLFTLAEIGKKKWPNFDLEWVPNHTKKGSEFTKRYLDVLKTLAKKANNYVVACDYDVEGEVIGLNVVRFACGMKDAKRMKFSTLTKEDLNSAYEKLSPSLDWGLAYAGETRHYLDWLYGINLSRALMSAMKKAGTFKIMSIGRVQGPALALVVKKEKEIMAFKSSPYWQVSLLVKNGHELLVKYPNNITKKDELEFFKKLKGKEGVAKTEKKEERLLPQTPFDLTTLQMEAHRLHGFSPARTLQLAQQLYLAGVISYPRTSSQKLPTSIGYNKILASLPKSFTKFAKRKQPIEGKKTDPAHPSIYPTGEIPGTSDEDQLKLYDLIVKRFINCFCDDAIIETKNIKVTVEGKNFSAKGLEVKEKGWLNVYPSRIEEKSLPDINGKITVKEVITEEKMTQPPHRYSDASLVSELAKRNLGTKSTRALIVETLKERGYVSHERQLKATPLGIAVTDSLLKNSPLILNEELTRKFEKEMESIQTSKKGEEEEKRILKEARTVLEKIAEELKKNEEKMGKELAEAQGEVRKGEIEASKLILCPKCQKGWVSIRRSRFGFFLGCNAYPECKNTYPLPSNALIKKTDKTCECGWPMLLSIKKAKRPWQFCANPACPRRQEKTKHEHFEPKEESDKQESEVLEE